LSNILAAEQIYAEAEKKSDNLVGQRVLINHMFRAQDDSNKWPISGKFNVTERAIRHANKFERDSDVMSPFEYALFLEQDMSTIVNDSKNW
jgi:spore germination protein YaaH